LFEPDSAWLPSLVLGRRLEAAITSSILLVFWLVVHSEMRDLARVRVTPALPSIGSDVPGIDSRGPQSAHTGCE
jgi:hypothetical protein